MSENENGTECTCITLICHDFSFIVKWMTMCTLQAEILGYSPTRGRESGEKTKHGSRHFNAVGYADEGLKPRTGSPTLPVVTERF